MDTVILLLWLSVMLTGVVHARGWTPKPKKLALTMARVEDVLFFVTAVSFLELGGAFGLEYLAARDVWFFAAMAVLLVVLGIYVLVAVVHCLCMKGSERIKVDPYWQFLQMRKSTESA